MIIRGVKLIIEERTNFMCGIVSYTGHSQAAPILLDGLSKLEYRGYDSAGLAVRDGENKTKIVKAKGRLKALSEKTDHGHALAGTCGIGHTRWATHGEPSETNAHPHTSDDGNVVGVHNGIIENYQELKNKLLRKDYEFYSSTDTEVAVKLIDYYYKKYEHTPVDAINHAMVRIRGSYALAIMFQDYPGEIYVARKDSPMIIGVENGDCYVASDVPAILKYTRNVYYIGNLEMARLANGTVTFYNLDGDEIEKKPTQIKWDAEAAEKAGYEHFMLKEIHEQPKAVQDTLNSVLKDGAIDLLSVGLTEKELQCLPEQIQKILDDKERIQWFAAKQANARDVFFIGRGLDYAISLEGSLKMKEISYIHSEAYAAGELKHGTISLIEDGILVIGVLTQSELYEKTISNMVECKSRGAYLMGLTIYGNYNIEDTASFTVYVPKTEECFATSLAVIPLQLMGYYVSVAKGLDVDKPRNLAKSVTVE